MPKKCLDSPIDLKYSRNDGLAVYDLFVFSLGPYTITQIWTFDSSEATL